MRVALPWADPHHLPEAFDALAKTIVERSGESSWTVVWAAGRAITSSDEQQCRLEIEAFRALLSALCDNLSGAKGSVVLTSSLGGVYGAPRAGQVIDETTEPSPISAYGESKLQQERDLQAFCADFGSRGIVARIATVYGPGQDIRKHQGLISALCRATLRAEPLRIFVPLDTLRHFLWSDDVGRSIIGLLDDVRHPHGVVTTRILAGSRATTVAEVIDTVGRVARRRAPVLISREDEARLHARYLVARTRHPVSTRGCVTPLAEGVRRCLRAEARNASPGRD